MITTLRAHLVMPIDRAVIEEGEVVVEDGIIQAVRPRSSYGDNVIDMGFSALVPGLVNVHTHLELTLLRGMVEDMPFFPWIRTMDTTRKAVEPAEWVQSARFGAAEALAGGITTVADCAFKPCVAEACHDMGLRSMVFLELFGLQDPLDPVALLADLGRRLDQQARFASDRLDLHVSPHAPYTVRPALLAQVAERQKDAGWRLAIHAAESLAEVQFVSTGEGEFGEWYRSRGLPWDAVGDTPIQHLSRYGVLGPNTQLIHCVHVSDDDIRTIASTGCSVAHCPKSNAKLAAGIARIDDMRTAGIPIGLGTDSVVSNNRLDMFEEMRQAIFLQRAAHHRVGSFTCRDALHLATLGGAESLWMADRTGSLTPGKQADICAVGLDRPNLTPYNDPYAALVYAAVASDVRLTMVAGEPLYRDGEWMRMDVGPLARSVRETARRLSMEAPYGRIES